MNGLLDTLNGALAMHFRGRRFHSGGFFVKPIIVPPPAFVIY